jgi:HD-GYP domain-containing protein (c-di-GMP phosphodiesterase class II)
MPFSVPTLVLNGMAILVLAALLCPFILKDRAELVGVVSIYRPLSLIFLTLNPLFILIAPFTSRALLPIALASILASTAFLAFEIRSSMGRAVPRRAVSIVLSAFLILVIVFEVIWGFGQSSPKYVGLISLLAVLMLAWICIEAAAAYLASKTITYLFVIGAAFIALVALYLRANILMNGTYDFDSMLLFDPTELFLTRSVAASGLLAMSIMLSQIYLDRAWKFEISSRKGAEHSFISTLSALSKVHDEETGCHIARTSEFVRTLAESLRNRGLLESNLRFDAVDVMSRAAPLHDIGKIGIPDQILTKPGKLNEAEWDVVKKHCSIGEEVLKTAAAAATDARGNQSGYIQSLLEVAAEIAGGHHENWDGSGYPRGLYGKAIPQSARIMSVADVYDALISARSYKQAWSHADAMSEIRALSGSKFDPDVVDAFCRSEDRIRQLAVHYDNVLPAR